MFYYLCFIRILKSLPIAARHFRCFFKAILHIPHSIQDSTDINKVVTIVHMINT